MRRSLTLSIAAALLVAWAPGLVYAQASPYVPTDGPDYRDLDALVMSGLVTEIITGQRPHSRMAFARFVWEARGRLEASSEARPKARFTEALERLERRFSAEIEGLCSPGVEACNAPVPYAAMRQAALDVTRAGSPPRAIPTGLQEGDQIDGVINPLLQNNQGRILADGWTAGGEGILDFAVGPRLAVQLRPRVWITEGAGGGGEPDVTLLQGYARTTFGKMSLEVGRIQAPHGPSRGNGPVVSANARGMDMIRLTHDRPARLPWVFRGLGPFRFTAFVADMGRDRDTPGSKLIVFEGAVRPWSNLELGGTILNHQGGDGAPEATWRERLSDILLLESRRFLPFSGVPPISDKALSLDARLTLPGSGVELYTEVMTTDDHNLFNSVRDGLWNNAAWIAGFRVMGLGDEGRVEYCMEWGHSGVRSFTHHQFSSGLTLDGRVIGSTMGPLAARMSGGLEWTGSRSHLALAAHWERYSGDHWINGHEAGFIRSADNPDEIRLRTTLDWTRHPDITGLRTTVRLGYEHVTRFDFTDKNRSNFMVQVRAEYLW